MVITAIVVGILAVLVTVAVGAAVLAAHLRSTAGPGQLQLRNEAFDKQVTGLHDEIRRMGDLVATLRLERAEQQGQVLTSLREATRTTTALSDTTRQLREALASPKARGQWGERMADDVLRLAGFVEGVNYVRQVALPGGTVPDITFLLPGDLVLHMDVKFPVDNYLRALEAPSPVERQSAEQAFLRDVRQRVKEIAGRGYVDPATTVDHVLVFIPNEAVYGFVHEHDPGLIDVALRQKVVLCSPCTLFAVLAVVRRAVEAFRLERRSSEVLECLSGFTEQWGRFSSQLDTVVRRVESVHTAIDDLAGPRRRQLQRTLDHLEGIGRFDTDRSDSNHLEGLGRFDSGRSDSGRLEGLGRFDTEGSGSDRLEGLGRFGTEGSDSDRLEGLGRFDTDRSDSGRLEGLGRSDSGRSFRGEGSPPIEPDARDVHGPLSTFGVDDVGGLGALHGDRSTDERRAHARGNGSKPP